MFFFFSIKLILKMIYGFEIVSDRVLSVIPYSLGFTFSIKTFFSFIRTNFALVTISLRLLYYDILVYHSSATISFSTQDLPCLAGGYACLARLPYSPLISFVQTHAPLFVQLYMGARNEIQVSVLLRNVFTELSSPTPSIPLNYLNYLD